jgi:hypothetical protein
MQSNSQVRHSAAQLASLKASINMPYMKPILKLLRRALGKITLDQM